MDDITSEIARRGFMFVLSSPSGAGKTTLSRLLLDQDDNLQMSVSVTTRPMRPGEEEGKDYFFVEQDKFSQMVANSELLECATVFDYSYGTPEKVVDNALDSGVDVLFDIDWQGTQQLARTRRQDLVSIFILPPSLKELEKRLRNRGSDSDAVIHNRMTKASSEISHWYAYDYVIVNNDLDESLLKIQSILIAERQKRERQQHLTDFIKELLDQDTFS